MRARSLWALGLALVVLAAGAGARFFFPKGGDSVRFEGEIFGTSYLVLIRGPLSSSLRAQVKKDIEKRLLELNHLFSTYEEDSLLSRFNAAPSGVWLSGAFLNPDFVAVSRTALEVASESSGYFDPTIGAVVNYWGFGPTENLSSKDGPEARRARVAKLLSQSGYRKLHLGPKGFLKDSKFLLDYSGIAKGYAVEEISKLLDKAGYHDTLVDIGGENCARGVKRDGVPWEIGVEWPSDDPFSAAGIHETLAISQPSGVMYCTAGSGNYRNFRMENGVRLSHEIDPGTGFPIQHDLASAHVISAHGALADAYATAFMAMGLSRALALSERKGIPAHFDYARVLERGEVRFKSAESSSWQAALSGARVSLPSGAASPG